MSLIESESPTRAKQLFPLREVVLPWFVSRLFVDLALLIAASSLLGTSKSLTAGFTGWDFGWYRHIAEFGYGPPPVDGMQSAWPFFPLFPGILRIAGWFGIPYGLTAFVVNHVMFLLALAGLYRLASRHLSPNASRLSIWALALFPASVSFSLGYPSAIFLAGSVWAFCFLEERRDWAAALLGVVVTMVRPNGILVVVAMGLAVLRFPIHRHFQKRAILIGAPSLLAIGTWCWQLDRWTGDPFAFWTAKAAWDELTIIEFINTQDHVGLAHVSMALVVLGVLVLGWKRLPLAWVMLIAAYLVPPGLFAVVGLGRYANETFPIAIAAGDLLDRWPKMIRNAVFLTSTFALTAFSVMVVSYDFVP